MIVMIAMIVITSLLGCTITAYNNYNNDCNDSNSNDTSNDNSNSNSSSNSYHD